MANKKQFKKTVIHIGSEEVNYCVFKFNWNEDDTEEDAGGVLHSKGVLMPCVFLLGSPVGSGLEDWVGNDGLTVKFETFHVTQTADGEEQLIRIREVEFQDVLFSGDLPEDEHGYFWVRGQTKTRPTYTVVKK